MRRLFSTTLAVLALAAPVWAVEAPTLVPTPAADALVAEAQAAVVRGAWEQAAVLYREALALASDHVGARTGLAQVEAIRQGVGDRSGVDLVAVERQLRVVEARTASERAELLARQGRPIAARQALEQARGTLIGIDASQDLRGDLTRIEQLIDEITPQVDAAHTQTAAAERAVVLAAAIEASGNQRQRQASILAERLERIRGLQRRLLFELALAEARALVRDVPGEAEAEALYESLLTDVHRQRAADLDEQRESRIRETHRRIEDALVPTGWDGRPLYPENWLSRKPESLSFSGESTQVEPWEEQLTDQLSQRLTLTFEDAPLDEALALLARQGRFNLIVDPSVYAQGAPPISLRVTDMRIDHVLNWLSQMSNHAWQFHQGAIYFGGTVDTQRVLAVYDIAFVVRVPADQSGFGIGFSAGGGDSGGFSLFEQTDTGVEQLAPEDVVDLIRSAVSPASWEDPANGIEIRGNQLYVTATRRDHQLLQEFFRSQVNARSLAVHIAARWLTISDTALEEIGVNWGAAENLLSILPGSTLPPGASGGSASHAWQGNAINRLPAVAAPIQPATSGSGLSLSMLRMGGTQLSAVLTAIERKAQGRILERPELVTLNGVRGNVFFGTQYAYIADYEVVNNTLDPVIEVLTIGASLDIKPFISADRKSVTMEFRPAIASVSFFTELILAPRNLGSGDNQIILLDQPYPIELPNVRLDTVSTTITVPDGGCLMVGGFNHTLDEFASAKVPFLGHIPFLGRLFGTRGRYNQRERLFLLANVRIIDYQEAEDRL